MSSRNALLASSAVLAILLFTIGCPAGTAENEAKDSSEKITDPAALLWNEELAGFRTWELVPGTAERMAGRGWHTALATIRANDVALTAMQEQAGEMPPGAILVKENFDENSVLVNIVAMQRSEHGWYWAQFSPEGSAEISGPGPQTCISCHGMAPNDQVFTWIKEVPSTE